MPYYKALFDQFAEAGEPNSARRAAAQLLKPRRQLARDVPARTVNDTLLLATWNLREFGSGRMLWPAAG